MKNFIILIIALFGCCLCINLTVTLQKDITPKVQQELIRKIDYALNHLAGNIVNISDINHAFAYELLMLVSKTYDVLYSPASESALILVGGGRTPGLTVILHRCVNRPEWECSVDYYNMSNVDKASFYEVISYNHITSGPEMYDEINNRIRFLLGE